jgi:hypothetical protein
MSEPSIPAAFIQWAYHGRAKLIQRQANGEALPPHEIFLGFCRHTPAVVSHGPAGLNASIKGVGFVPKPEYIPSTIAAYLQHIEQDWRPGQIESYSEKGLQLLVELLYSAPAADRIDFTCFGTLELARDHTWTNVQADPTMTLLFYQPPAVSFEVRGRVEIHTVGSPYHQLLNAQHDVYHQPDPSRWQDRPAYLFQIESIFDNSATPQGFGRPIYPLV